MAETFRRAYQRFPCEIEITVRRRRAENKPIPGVMLDVGVGGAHICIQGVLEREPFNIEISIDGKIVPFRAVLARAIGADSRNNRLNHYGITFKTHMGNIHLLRKVIDAVRGSGWAKRIGSKSGEVKRDYWKL